MSTIIIVGLFASVGAAPLERPQEINKVYEYQGGAWKGYGAQVNADFSRLDRLLGVNADMEMPRASQGKTEEDGWLGIAMKLPVSPPIEPGSDHVLRAVEVDRVMPGSAAEVAGLRKGDMVVGIDGEAIEGDKVLLAFRLAISRKPPGDKVKLRVLREGSLLEPVATLKSYPRVKSILKPHPELKKIRSGNESSLLADVLKKEALTDEFARLGKQLRSESDKVVSLMVSRDDYNPFRLQEVNYLMAHPLDLPVVARKNITDRLHGASDKTHHDLAELLRTAMDELDMTYAPVGMGVKKMPVDFTGYVERLLDAIQHANSERAAVFSVLSTEEIEFLYAYAPELLKGDAEVIKEKEQPEDEALKEEKAEAEIREYEARTLRFFEIALKLDLPRLLNAGAEVAMTLDLEALTALDNKIGKLEHYPVGWSVREEDNLTIIDTPAGRVLVGGGKGNTYSEDAALIIDFGGDDKYFNQAGGSTRSNPFSIVIDLSGNDVYSTSEDFAQGAGLLGGGFLIDLAGDDQHAAKNYSQGAGIFGVGILVDFSGRDQYTAIAASQGAGSFGIGTLADGGGNDSYFGNRFVQGFGYIKGFGAIVEAEGNDNYFAGGLYEDFRAPGKSYQSLSQGFGYGMRPSGTPIGASGGIGVLAEAEGNDTYVADYFAQGSSYWFALGILDDRKGNDRYIAGRYSQGAGIHMSIGVLLDGEGDDNYLADFGVAQGCGHDYGIGFLLNNGGNDRYIAGVIAQGTGNENGIGVLSDNGGNDEYYLKSIGQGRGNFEPVSDVGSFGFLFDTEGTDIYSQGSKNNSLIYKTQWGILVDTN